MNREEIINMAREAGLLTTTGGYQVWMPDNLEAFAALVAAAEREACAGELKALRMAFKWTYDSLYQIRDDIGARGEK